ncbi:unnamed protein product [Rotaria sp. Silwood1]|nr:unnamed protein product [Rotaria sp. Silwood1]CAF3689796.1 unnamed protein product [Rotaria sp. Silwood1]CAF3744380.1 unnamed protein product [Rotaria sp. Silwood1]CAF3825918.1 unnamed protein product [Rotaria sp. Silwood1]CAF4798786.1 unnamed protein product [Rotaria sp. Silwood1]
MISSSDNILFEIFTELCEGTKQSSKLPYESLLLLHLLPLLLVNIDLPNNSINKMVLGFSVSIVHYLAKAKE